MRVVLVRLDFVFYNQGQGVFRAVERDIALKVNIQTAHADMFLPFDDDIRERVRARRYRAGQFGRELTGRVRKRAGEGERFQKLTERRIAEAVVVLLRFGGKEPREKVTVRVLVS